MKISNKIDGSILVSPLSFVIITAILFSLAVLENPLNWVAAYGWSGNISYDIVTVYLTSIILGILIGSVASRTRYSNGISFNFNLKYLWYLFYFAAFFQVCKFINVGDIPLFGNPHSRYLLTLGGFEDYPTRLIAPLAILFFLAYLKTDSRKFLIPVVVGFFLNFLFLQRQEVLNVILGCLLVFLFTRKVKIISVVLYILGGFFAVYLLIGVGAVLRFGADQLSSSVGLYELPLWVVHADLTSAYIFGQSILEDLSGDLLYGKYSFGAYISIFIPDYSEHGAEFIRKYFTDKDTAQSIGVPFSYFIDFGYYSLIPLSMLKGFLLSIYYNNSIREKKASDITIYIILYLNALWSVRSGIIIISPIVLYIIIAIFVFKKFNRTPYISGRDIITLLFLSTFVLSLGALAIRI
ncbi:hypothetical protein [Photobacterium sp. DNB22_13_2]